MDRRHRIASTALALLVSNGATALDVNVVGLFPNKAVVQIEGGALQTLSIGQKTRDNIILLSVERDGATFDIQGRRLVPFYSHTGRPSIDPELMVRMLIIGYSFGIRSERRLCEEGPSQFGLSLVLSTWPGRRGTGPFDLLEEPSRPLP